MSVQTVDPFDLDEETGPPRDQWGRPLLIPAKGGERQPYTRMSTLADFVTTKEGLVIWQRRQLALGMALREDLCGMVAALPELNDARCDKSMLTKEQVAQDKATKKKYDEYIETALDAAGANYKANHGTAVHGFIEKGSSEHAPERMKPDIDSCLEALERMGAEILASEVFVANDDIMASGSLDHLVHIPKPGWGVVIVDVKTGQVKDKELSFAVQLAGYVNGDAYDWRDDSRAPLESLTGGLRINRKVGLVAHVPLGGKRTEWHRVDLARGQHCARLAANVRTARSLDLTSKVEDF